MKSLRTFGVIVALMLSASTAYGQSAAGAYPDGFKPIAFMAGSCWEGPLPGFVAASLKVTPRAVTHCARWRLENQILTDTISIEGMTPEIQGETNFYWDPESKVMRYIHWSTAGQFSYGTMKVDGATLIFDDEILVGGSKGPVQFVSTWTPSGPDAFVQERKRRNSDGTWTDTSTSTFKRKPMK